jgi:ribulose-5-phosphate 4-epimerase/fuculose-1-phosphate aldolase
MMIDGEGDDRTLPSPLSPEAELALLCRMLARHGYRDNIAGHATYAQPDGSLLINPFELLWEEVRASDIMRVDRSGAVISGRWTVTPALPLHLATHEARPDIAVAVHNHPEWGTVWANAGRIPPIYDQTSAFISEEIAVYDEYRGGVNEIESAHAAARAIGRAGCAFLVNHGVLVVADTIRQAYLRAMALEKRCKLAWHVEALGGHGVRIDPDVAVRVHDIVDRPDISAIPHLWTTAVRRELRADPAVLN